MRTPYQREKERGNNETANNKTGGNCAAAINAKLLEPLQPTVYRPQAGAGTEKGAEIMRVTSDTRIITVSEPRAELFDRRINNILNETPEAELIFHELRPLTAYIIYRKERSNNGNGK